MMNPGPVEEVGKATGFFMTIMKDQPLSLALVIMNVALLVLFWMIMDRVSETRGREMKLIYDEHKEVRELLAKCVIPPRVSFPSWLPMGFEEKQHEDRN